MKLAEKLNKSLPFEVCLGSQIIEHLQKSGKNIKKGQKYTVTDVFDSGDFGGIVCAIPHDNEAMVISITHLIIDSSHPLSSEIKKYQNNRLAEIGS